MMRRGSITVQVLGLEILAIVVVAVFLPLVTVSMLHRTMDMQQRVVLSKQAEMIGAGLRYTGSRISVGLSPALEAVYQSAFDGRSFVILNQQGHDLVASPGSRSVRRASIPLRGEGQLFHLGSVVGYSQPFATTTGLIWIVACQNEDDPGAVIDDVGRIFLSRYIVLLVVVLAILPLISAVVLRRLVHQVRVVSARAADIGPQRPGLRLDESKLPIEVVDLARATNRLVDRLEETIAHQRAFVADIVHELKTPLARLKLQIDGLERGQEQAFLDRSIDKISHVISQMRDLSELEMLEISGRDAFDLRDVARDVAESAAPQIYSAAHKLELVVPEEPVNVLAGRVLIELALRNLVENARQHTPPGTVINVRISADGTLEVRDDGPGMASEVKGKVMTRFWRADQSRTDNAGLGLSIVSRVCEVHGASLEIETHAGKGSRFSFRVPLHLQPQPSAK